MKKVNWKFKYEKPQMQIQKDLPSQTAAFAGAGNLGTYMGTPVQKMVKDPKNLNKTEDFIADCISHRKQ